jgi:hypothetical protein
LDNYYSFERQEGADGSVHYVFSTEFGIIYSAYFNPPDFSEFLNDLPHLSKCGRLFGFFPIDEQLNKNNGDPQVSNTICKIIEDYFTSYGHDKVLLYHCDSDDERQGCRFRLFNRWHRNNKGMNIYSGGKEVEIDKPDGSKKNEYIGFIVFGEEQYALNIIEEEFLEISAILIDHKR